MAQENSLKAKVEMQFKVEKKKSWSGNDKASVSVGRNSINEGHQLKIGLVVLNMRIVSTAQKFS